MKTVKVPYEVWKELKRRALDQDTTIGSILKGLLDG